MVVIGILGASKTCGRTSRAKKPLTDRKKRSQDTGDRKARDPYGHGDKMAPGIPSGGHRQRVIESRKDGLLAN